MIYPLIQFMLQAAPEQREILLFQVFSLENQPRRISAYTH
ncbi:hypothetical protein TREAZ_2235 [Leadbettera azotonutricia ZAS-9]|uniref:Uncharacterized protein n=1 Tax=Leadbettera azotonutricia (strain ATCC BAA-888 / DSM 13862 / ZAS-9) TaxID=545695 RepID=F5Y8M3_LEAAZ|nr:hypothetical protein TREAZ_2235 [Leadbettera azotonutricia ZAS-9]